MDLRQARTFHQELTGLEGANDAKALIIEAHALLGGSVVGLSNIGPYHQALVLIDHLSGTETPLQAHEFPQLNPDGTRVTEKRKRRNLENRDHEPAPLGESAALAGTHRNGK